MANTYTHQMNAEYAERYGVPVIHEALDVRKAFLAKVYMLFGAGLFVAMATCFVALATPAVMALPLGLMSLHWGLYLLVLFGITFGVNAVARVPVLNVVAYGIYAIFLGLLTAPLVGLAGATGGSAIVLQALVLTGVLYAGLSIWALTTKEDLSGWGMFLAIGGFVLLGVAIVAMIFGGSLGLWYSAVWVALLGGYTMYETQMIQRRYSADMWVIGAIGLLTNFIVMFWHILTLLMGNRR